MSEPRSNSLQKRIFGNADPAKVMESLDVGNDSSDYSSDIDSSFENSIINSDAQQQWDENMKQLETAIFFVLCPVIGRLVGRKTAHNLWIRFVTWRWNNAKTNNVF